MLLGTAEDSRRLEAATAAQQDIPSYELMERAGSGAANLASELLQRAPSRVVVVCGKGNNGGDGLEVARLLAERGNHVSLFLACAPGELKGDAAQALSRLPEDLSDQLTSAPDHLGKLPLALEDADLVVDAVLGSGLRGEVRGPAREAIECINSAGCPTLAIDLPSGLHSDTGQICGVAVRAAVTAAIEPIKAGLYLYPGAEHVGEIRPIEIGIPRDLAEQELSITVTSHAEIGRLLPPRPKDGHKRTFGEVAVIAGSPGMTGAPSLAALAALRGGAGLCYLLCGERLLDVLSAKVTEVILIPLPDEDDGPGEEAAAQALKLISELNVALIGPGLTTSDRTRVLVERVITTPRPLVLDADALNVLAGSMEALAQRKGPTIITPHPGELARLLGSDSQTVQSDRLGAAREAAQQGGCVVVLKGARTVVGTPDGTVVLCPLGNSGLASAGTGDVLAGLIAGLWAQGMDGVFAAEVGVHVHALAGDLAAAELTEYAMVAGDLLYYLPGAFKHILSQASEEGPIDGRVPK